MAVATQAQLMWRRFRKHRLAMLGAIGVILFYLVVVLADFLAYADPEAADAQRGLISPQGIHLLLGSFSHMSTRSSVSATRRPSNGSTPRTHSDHPGDLLRPGI